MNIHRTPFAGRNFEYYSEDSFMSGEMAYQAVKGAAEKGMYAFIKHFALNDQEDHRTGLCTWSNEQAIREIYLAAFKKCFEGETVKTTYYEQDPTTNEFVKKEGNTPMCTAVMSSFNRIGYTWSGGDYRLITQVLRNEWGFNGMVLTDYSQGSTSYMHTEQMIRAGGDCQLTQQGNGFNIKTDANKYYTQQAMKHVLFTVVNSNAMNGFIHGVEAKEQPFAYYILIEIALEILLAGGIATCAFFAVKRFRDEKKENAQ